MSIKLDHMPLRPGQPNWVTTRVVNVGRDDLIWFHDGCATSVGVYGSVEATPWRPGVAQVGVAADFKRNAVGDPPGATITVAFTPEAFIGIGQYGCADIGIGDRIKPGGVIRQRAQWDGMAWYHLGPPPAGPVRLVGSFQYYWRAGAGEPRNITSRHLDVALDTRITDGGPPSLLDPAEVVDAALASPDFAAWLGTRRIGHANEPILAYDRMAGLWIVGLIEYDPEHIHLLLVDPFTGAIVGTVDRPSDRVIDAWP